MLAEFVFPIFFFGDGKQDIFFAIHSVLRNVFIVLTLWKLIGKSSTDIVLWYGQMEAE